jgi:hypothetical protein
LRLKSYDYTNCLSPEAKITELWQADSDQKSVREELQEGINITITLDEGMLQLETRFEGEPLSGKFVRLAFEFQEAGTDIWAPLECAETSGKSTLTLVYDHPGKESAWDILRKYSGAKLEGKLSSDHLQWLEENLSEVLLSCSKLSSIKYPGIVFAKQAKHLASLSFRLGICLQHKKTVLSSWYRQGVVELDALNRTSDHVIVRRFLLSSLPHSLTTEVTGIEIDPENTSHVARSMLWGSYIASQGGRVALAIQAFTTSEKLTHEMAPAFGSFVNFGEVINGREKSFSHFNATKYFSDLHAEIKRLEPRDPDLDDAPILSPRHYMLATRQLKRSDRLLRQSSLASPEHILNISFQPLTASHRATETMMPGLNDKVGYKPASNGNSLCPSNSFEECCPRSRQLADLAWTWALTLRLKAHGQIPETTYENLINALIPEDAGAYNSLSLVLNYSSDLFAFYVALIDFAHFKKLQ